ncbi:hypothetical protein NKG05_20300 [Oerskovia sp. M15]
MPVSAPRKVSYEPDAAARGRPVVPPRRGPRLGGRRDRRDDAVPAPTTDELRPGLEPTDVSPGLPGFLTMFAVALACVVLFLSLTKQLRKVNRSDRPGAPGSGDGAAAQDVGTTRRTGLGDSGSGDSGSGDSGGGDSGGGGD